MCHERDDALWIFELSTIGQILCKEPYFGYAFDDLNVLS